jgi:hypothetical protein
MTGMLKKIYTGLLFSGLLTTPVFAYNLRQLSSKDGLSNSAIQAIVQDKERLMWFGSCDGLNMYDGLHIHVYKPTPNNPTSLSGNLIEGIMEAEDNILWIATNHGFNRLDKKKHLIEHHDEFQGKYHWAKTTTNDIFVISEDHAINYYDKTQKVFRKIAFPDIVNDQIRHFFIDANNMMWILSDDGKIITATIEIIDCNYPPPCTLKLLLFSTKKLQFITSSKNRNGFITLMRSTNCMNTTPPAGRKSSFKTSGRRYRKTASSPPLSATTTTTSSASRPTG